MREILFRAKHIDTGKWIYGDLIHEPFGVCIQYLENSKRIKSKINELTISQYTGLTDKNGNKIWENDIVRYQFDNDDCPFPNKHTEKIIGRIFFSDFRASFSVTAGRNGSTMMNNDLFKYVQNGNRVEVVGNVFDNADLLKESED